MNPATAVLTGTGAADDSENISTLCAPGFFNAEDAVGAEETILHELGHLLYNLGYSSQITPDADASGAASAANDRKIMDACGKYLR